MELSINYNSSATKNYKFYPEDEIEEIAQNVENILARFKGNIPLAREKGIGDIIDMPQMEAMMYAQMYIIQELEREEPRFRFKEMNFEKSRFTAGEITIDIVGEIGEIPTI